MNKITVKINSYDYPEDWALTPVLYEMWIVGKLKDAGIPIRGTILFRGLERGILTRTDDPEDFGQATYTWIDK
jgi:hypothetical protein